MRTYLSEIGRIPLLTRQQEIALAKQLEVNRRRFRCLLLECDFVLRDSLQLLERVNTRELPFDRLVQVAVSDRLEKHHVLHRLPHNLQTLEAIVRRNDQLWAVVANGSLDTTRRRDAWRALMRSRRRAVRLIEELGLRIEYIEPQAEQASERRTALKDEYRKASGPEKQLAACRIR